MPSYRYQAKDKESNSVNGVIEAPDEKSAIGLLRQKGLTPTSINEEKAKAPTGEKKSSFFMKFGSPKIKLSELVLFSRQMATMVSSGIPLIQALEIMAEQVEDVRFRAVLNQVKKDVATGVSFYESLAKHPNTFSQLFINMVKAGESSGSLDNILERLASYLEKTDSLIRKVKSAMTYPAVVSLMAFCITLVMILKVVPVFKSIFADFGGKLPLPTQILIMVSDTLGHYFLIVAGIIAAIFFMLRRFFKTEKGELMLDGFKLNVPVFGIIIRKVAISKFCRTLSTLVKSGVPILAALEIVGKTAGNKIVEGTVEKVRSSIREGENITDPLTKSKIFPPLVTRMISVGEQTGELENMLSKIADFYDDQVDAAVSGITSLIEPLIIAFLGVVIGGIVICMFLPIFQLSTLVGGNG